MSGKNYTDTNFSGPEQAILFVILSGLWAFGFVVLAIILAPDANEEYLILHQSIDRALGLATYLKAIFRYADDWSWMTLFVALTLITLLFNINDLFLKPRFRRWFVDNDLEVNFWYSGLLWSLRIGLNGIITILQIILIAFTINIFVGHQRILSTEELSGNYEVIVLGTSKYLNGTSNINQYYQERINAVVELYRGGFVSHILISGDHQGASYSEPLDMRKDLMAQGVPDRLITMDFGGYRTFDSIKKLKKDTRQPLLFVSQQFHLERALFIAANSGIHAFGFAASGDMTSKMIKREALAKVKVILDIYILNTQAFGLPARVRRNVSIFNMNDLILLVFVCCMVGLAGRMTRNLLLF